MNFKELVSPTLTDLFVKEIERMILSGELLPGEKLPNERELAAKMNVSRAVINGGTAELERKGFIEVVPRKGNFVADYRRTGRIDTLISILEYNGGRFDPQMLNSIFEIRSCLECSVARLAAVHRSEQDIIDLKEHINKIEALSDPVELSCETFSFYHTLSIISGNIIHPLLTQGFKPIYLPLMEAIYKHDSKEERLHMMRKLMESIECSNAEEAEGYIMDMIRWGRDSINKYYKPGQVFL